MKTIKNMKDLPFIELTPDKEFSILYTEDNVGNLDASGLFKSDLKKFSTEDLKKLLYKNKYETLVDKDYALSQAYFKGEIEVDEALNMFNINIHPELLPTIAGRWIQFWVEDSIHVKELSIVSINNTPFEVVGDFKTRKLIQGNYIIHIFKDKVEFIFPLEKGYYYPTKTIPFDFLEPIPSDVFPAITFGYNKEVNSGTGVQNYITGLDGEMFETKTVGLKLDSNGEELEYLTNFDTSDRIINNNIVVLDDNYVNRTKEGTLINWVKVK